MRLGQASENPLIVALNMTPVTRQGYRATLPEAGRWQVIFSSDAVCYGGSGMPVSEIFNTFPEHETQILSLDLPPLGGLILAPVTSD
jgi:1,4-alpha-glucan branching enzyme